MKKHKHHTGKIISAHDGMKSVSGKDKMAHSSHHDNHGVGTQKGMHGFGPNMAPPEEYQGGAGGANVECCD